MIALISHIKGPRALNAWSRTLDRRSQTAVHRLVQAYCLKIEREAKRSVPVDTGVLRASINSRVEGWGMVVTGRVGTNRHYGPYVEYGTGLFGPKKRKITPTSAQALSWIPKSRGKYVTARSGRRYYKPGQKMTEANRVTVRSIKGMKPRPFLVPAFESVLPDLQRDLHLIVKSDVTRPW